VFPPRPLCQASAPEDTDDEEALKAFEDDIHAERFKEAEIPLTDYLKAHPSSWRAHYMLGFVALRLRKLSESIKELSKSLEINVNNAEAHKTLGEVLSVVGRYEEAQTELEEARRLEPDSPEIHYLLSRVLVVQDKFPPARQELGTAIRLNPNYKEAYNALGFVLEGVGDSAAALASYRRAIEISEQEGTRFAAPYVNLSDYYNRQNNFDLALENAKKAIELDPKSEKAYFEMTKTYRSLGDWSRAADALEHAVTINPYYSEYYYVLSFVYRKLGKVKQSEEAMAKFKKLENDTAHLEVMPNQARQTHPPETAGRP
jgi:tetratricopeptide (TPR) repeat protein